MNTAMCVVIADDFTGASEIAGVGLRYGLVSGVSLGQVYGPLSQFAVICTGTRSLSESAASARIRGIAQHLCATSGRLIVKKVDSVLRGPVLAEIRILLAVSGKRRALLVPANPSRGRTIRSGHYYVGGQPIHRTHFHADPEWPVTSSRIEDMLHATAGQVMVAAPGENLPAQGIVVGEASCREDLAAWAAVPDDDTLMAGAADFAASLLEARGYILRRRDPAQAPSPSPTLVVSGSSSRPSHDAIAEFKRQGVPIIPMPDALLQAHSGGDDLVAAWSRETAALLAKNRRAVMTIGGDAASGRRETELLVNRLARAAAGVLARVNVRSLWLEGGRTAEALARATGWKEFQVEEELTPGAVLLRPAIRNGPRLLVKPGSYAWPAAL